MTSDQFRFETGSVYQFSQSHSAYLFLCTYRQAGIESKNRLSTKVQRALKYLEEQF